MDLKALKRILEISFRGLYPNIKFENSSFPNDNNLLFPHLTRDEFKEVSDLLKAGDGSPLKEIYKINSSTSLAVYYYSLLAKEYPDKIKGIKFEHKIGIPLIKENVRKKHPNALLKDANIDVFFELNNNTAYFVESKFLEPYYSKTILLSEKYLDKDCYGENAKIWVEYANLINKNIQDYSYYNITQMFKHLLAIYNHREDWSHYSNLVLLNVGWEITEHFINLIKIGSKRSVSYIQKRNEQLNKQKDDGIKLLNDIIDELKWDNCEVKFQHYNDEEMLGEIKNNQSFEDFSKRYLFAK